jgi:hypothetical protein
MGWIPGGSSPHVHFLLPQESTVEQGQQVFGLHFGLLPLAVWIWLRRGHRRRCPCSRSGGLFAAPLLPAVAFVVFDGDGFIL